ncbi:hypothetical protein B0H16DRAFT_1686927 [Mycena metata]|uniref:Uncharacterized protein n=1 Tax=Mycena metata TaxID=1033252 RepID=A0AAD7JKB4_9AGAR|nr:hypothetical protein B0H16DRAFT_1686927 [Mycena metata]
MARGGRAQRAQPAQELIWKDSVQLPQELIDTIIDEFDVSLTHINYTSIFPDRHTLRSCALVSRAFVRPSQKKLFSIVSIRSADWNQSPDERMRLFSKLLASRPHIAQYVRTLNLGYRCARSKSLDHILLSLPNLNTVNLYPWRDSHSRNWQTTQEFPMHHRDSFVVVFSLSSLRSLALRDHRFTNPVALLSMLGESTGLEELVLQNIEFANLEVAARPKNPAAIPRLVLKSLKLIRMLTTSVDALLDASSPFNLSRLHSLCCDRYHPSLFQATRSTVRDLTLIADSRYKSVSGVYLDGIDQVFPGVLQNLSLNVDDLVSLSSFIRRLKNFNTAIALKRISITIYLNFPDFGAPFWQDIHSLLSSAPAVEEISFNLRRNHAHGVQSIRAYLPVINAKGILKIALLDGDLRIPELR